jgi:hypothetical protein
MGLRIFKRLRDLLDVDFSTFQDGDRVVYQSSSDKFVGMASAGGASSADDITFTPAGNIAATDVQAALEEIDTEKAATSHVHSGADITSGTVADARIASTIARDSEVDAAIAAHEADTTNVHGIADTSALDTVSARNSAISTSEAGQVRDGDAAGGVLGGTYPNPSFAADMATQAELDAAISGLSSSYQPLDSDLTAFAGLAIAADKLPYGSGSHALSLADFTAAARALLDDADAATMRATLGVIASLFQSGGAQAIKLDDLATPDDNTDLNASTSAHGLLKKLPGDTTTFLRADGSFATPASGAEDPVADALGTPDTAFEFETSSLTGLTAIGTADVVDAHTTVPHNLYFRDDGGSYVGRYLAATVPFTVVTRMTDKELVFTDGYKAGVFVGDSSPALSADCDVLLIGNSGHTIWVELAATTNVYNLGQALPTSCYLAIRVNSSTDVDYLVSVNGRIWRKHVDSRNPGIGTIASCGLCIAGSTSPLMAAAFDYLRIWNSAKSFPGALA